MGRSIPNKNRKRKYPTLKSAKAQRIRRKKELVEKIKRSTEVHLNSIVALESSYDLPVISAVHGKDYFEKHPFSVKLVDENEVHFETTDSTVIKIESCEEESNSHGESDKSILKTVPETLKQHHLKDHNIPSKQINNSGSKLMHISTPNFSYDKENALLFDVIKYLDECAKVDKFDLAGKLYASKLRCVMFTNQQAMAENLCRQVLLEAEHFNLDEKIVLSKQHPHDYLSNRKSRINVASKSHLEQFSYHQLQKDSLLQNIRDRLSENTREDRFDKFGKFYASKMRSFSDIQYFYADKLINEIVLEAELCRLRANYKLGKLGDPPSHTFATGKSYSKKCRSKVSDFPASDQACAINKMPLKQSDQLLGETVKKSVVQCRTYSKSVIKPSLAPLTPTSDVTSIKNNVHELPKSASSTAQSKTVLKACYSKKKIKEYFDRQQINGSVNEEIKNSSFNPSASKSKPDVISVQNNAHQFPKSLPSSSPVSNASLDTPKPKKTRNSANEQVKNSSVKGFKNSSLKLSVLPLTPAPAFISFQNNVNQLPQIISSPISKTFLIPASNIPIIY